ncbi:M-phase inducer phosphatase [Calliphora vicina]|uniref:M-phase inducer phosphatase n=1 Tax=Calliphora vicina TaxID=7373 RepID=UPI00325BB85A
MRVGKKPNVVEAKKTRSCVVRLEKFSKKSPNVSPSPEDNRKTTRLSSTAMAPTPKQRRGGGVTLQQEEKPFGGTIKKRIVGGSNSNLQTPQQKATNTNMSNIRSNQKIKIIPRSNKTTPASTPSREETPPPTIAAGRSRRAIKPNPKYASEDLVTPKVVRNVATLGSSTSRGSTTAGKTRKASTSSDDFYNRNSDDEYDGNQRDMDDDDEDEDMRNDKAYQANDKDENDSDFSVIEEQPVRAARPRGRPKRVQEPTPTNNKLPTLAASSSVKRTTNSATVANSSNLRSAPSQLQQIRRSLASANAQRNINLLSGTAQKRKLEELQDSSDNESSYTIKRKQLVLSNSTGPKVIMPVKENRVNASSTPLAKSRLAMQKMSTTTPQHMQQPQTVNGSNKINNSQTTSSRRAIEISAKSHTESITKSSLRQTTNANAAMTNQHMQKPQNQNSLTTQAKILAAKSNRLRIGSPKLPMQKERQNNGSAISISSGSAGSSSSLNTNSKTSDKTKALNAKSSALKSKTTTSPHNTNANSLENINEIKDDSPNSTMDDFETMPTFTIVNVNDIINKKGDVLITKAKANNNSKTTPTVIEFSESISLDDDDDDDDNDNDFNDDVQEVAAVVAPPPKKLQKLSTLNNRKEFENNRKSPMTRSSESLRKLPTKPATSAAVSSSNKNQAPQILNHKLGLRNSRVSAKATTTLTATLKSPDKPAPRILNSVVGKKTQPVKPMISNMDDSADESFPLSLDEDDDDDAEVEEETEDEIESRTSNLMQMTEKARKRDQQQHHNHQNLMEVDTEDTESQNTEEDDTVLQTTNNNANFTNASNAVALTPKQNTASQRRRRTPGVSNTPIVVSSNKKRLTPAAAKENSLAATNQQINDTTTGPAAKQSLATTLPVPRKSNAEKVVISKQGDKIIKKITCFETWYVINMPMEAKRPAVMKNQLEMPLIRLANNAKNVCLPNDLWSSKVTLYELSAQTLGKGTFAHFTGDLYEHHIKEEDRGKYQPSCVMFRRSIEKNHASRMPYDRAVIFKNKTFYTNIEGKNVRLVGAPSIINTEKEIEILLEVVDGLTLQSDFVEHISIVQ